MTFTDLKYILAIVEEKNMTQAAKKLFISQPSLSQRVQKVENELKINLFVRTAGGIELTESGAMFISMSRSVLHTYDIFMKQIEETLSSEKIKLDIGIPPMQSLTVIPTLVELFPKLYPEVQLVFRELSSNKIEEKLISGELDLGIMHIPIISNLIAYKAFQRDQFCIYLRNGSPLFKQANRHKREGSKFYSLSLQLLKNEPFGVTYPGQRSRIILDRIFKEEGITPNIVQEMQNFDNLISLSNAGFCTVLQPLTYYKSSFIDPNRIFEIDSHKDYSFDFVIAYNINKPYSKVIDSIYKILYMKFK